MKSIKPGRGPSMMGGTMSILMGLFGLVWTVVAAGMGGGVFALFGVIFIIVAIVQAVYHFKNATSESRYSTFDITDGDEEPDPLNERFGAPRDGADGDFSAGDGGPADGDGSAFCPYCGAPLGAGFEYCNKCGKKLP